MSEDELSLTWKSYSDHIKDMLENMRVQSTLTDVTLVCEDKTTFNAHKVVLSACSPIFQSIISSMGQQNSVIYLRGIQSNELEPILQFMYLGNATFPQNSLTELLDVAGSLEIKGIHKESKSSKNESNTIESENFPEDEVMNQGNGVNKELSITMNEKSEEEKHNYVTELNADSDSEDNNRYFGYNNELSLTKADTAQNEDIAEKDVEKDMKSEADENPMKDKGHHNLVSEDKLYINLNYDHTVSSVSSQTSVTTVKSLEKKYKCPECDTQFKALNSMIAHVNHKHVNDGVPRYQCNLCQKAYTKLCSLKVHYSVKHEGIRHNCKFCSKVALTKSDLSRHIRTKH